MNNLVATRKHQNNPENSDSALSKATKGANIILMGFPHCLSIYFFSPIKFNLNPYEIWHKLLPLPDLSWKTRSRFRHRYPDSNFSGDGADVLIDWRPALRGRDDRKRKSPLGSPQESQCGHDLHYSAGMRPNENCVCEDYDLSCHYYLTFGGLKCEAKRKRMLRRLRRNRK